MHRMTSRLGQWLLPLLVATFAAHGCASGTGVAGDPPIIERLRLSIAKTRNAIDETRETIARSQGSSRLPELYVRLGELLSEEARYHNQVAYEREERKSRNIHAPQVQLLKYQAIAIYREVVARFPESPLIPVARFNIGHELRELGEFEAMVKELETLIDKHPDSRLATEALLVLGDYHFDRSELAAAGKHYGAIVRRGASRVLGLASYKLAWVQMNQGDCAAALTSFEGALAATRDGRDGGGGAGAADLYEAPSTAQSIDGGSGIDVGREALVDLVYCYTQERDLMAAQRYLKVNAQSRAAYVAASRRMADRLSLMGRPDAGLPVSRELLRFAPADADRLDDARVLYAFLKSELRSSPAAAAAPGSPPAGPASRRPGARPGEPNPGSTALASTRYLFRSEDIQLIIDAVSRWAQLPSVPDEVRVEAMAEFERYARDLLTSAQERLADPALGATARELGRSTVAAGYTSYLATFKDSAERLAMQKNLADLELESGRHYRAGLAFLEVADGEVEGPARQEALLSAVSQLQRSLEDKGMRSATERFVARAALRRAGLSLLAGGLATDESRAVKFAIAVAFFDEGRFRDAIDRFVALAYEHPKTEEGSAAMLYALDAHDAMNDFDGLIALGQRFVVDPTVGDSQVKEKIKPFVARAEQRKLDELALAAAGSGGTDLSVLERFAERYAGTSLGERALVNAFVAARAVGDGEAVQRLGQDIVKKYPQSEQTSGVISTMAKAALASLDYQGAIRAFEQAAGADGADRLPLLMAAAEIEAQLGNPTRAESMLLDALRGAKTPGARNQVGARLAQVLEERAAPPQDVLRLLGPLVPDRDGDVLAAYGLAQLEQGDVDAAEATFQTVLGGQVEASAAAKARAKFGKAEAMALLLLRYQPSADLDGLNELTALVDLMEESYLDSARSGDPLLTPMTLGRLTTVARQAAQKLNAVTLPSDLSADDRTAVAEGLKSRAGQLEELAAGALSTCAGQSFANKVFNAAVRKCLANQSLPERKILHDALSRRTLSGAAELAPSLRKELSDSPEDAAVLMKVGTALIDNNDPHVARIVLARAVTLSTGVTGHTHNLLGIAHFMANAYEHALESFARAADLGLEAGRENLRTAVTRLGLGPTNVANAPDPIGEIDKRWPSPGEPGGRLLGGVR